MASKIRVLNEQTINQIAAGEVIENPASVVKELVENSIDAGAKEIYVEIKGGGRQMIRVSDDGCGMNMDDALLCLERHATSKIRTVEELHLLSTMGFRGEAIPSIASISKFMLLTCPLTEESQSTPTGTMVIVDGGKIVSCNSAARAPGTTIEVKSLFFNVPVRKKFLKSPAFDVNEIQRTVSLLALGYPEIKFQLINEGKILLTAPQVFKDGKFSEKLKERIGNILGQDFVQNTTYLETKNDLFEIHGVIGLPCYNRHNRTGQYLFINRRAVISPSIMYAIKEGYGTSLAAGRYPVYVLHLSIPGDFVDVNVHPQKKEVRLRQEYPLRELFSKAIAKTLQYTPLPTPSSAASPVFVKAFQSEAPLHSNEKEDWIFQPKIPLPPASSCTMPYSLPEIDDSSSYSPMHFALEPKSEAPPSFLPLNQNDDMHLPSILGIIPGYILLDTTIEHPFVDNRKGLFIIDQRAAHARIIFEKLWQVQTGHPVAQQTLLIPYPIEVTPVEAEALRSFLPYLNQLGFHLQEFGSTSFLLDAIPQVFGNTNVQTLIKDIFHDLRDAHPQEHFKQEKLKKMALAASRSAVSYNRKLALEEAQALIKQLVNCQHPYQCPSGKSTFAHLSPEGLLKLFQK